MNPQDALMTTLVGLRDNPALPPAFREGIGESMVAEQTVRNEGALLSALLDVRRDVAMLGDMLADLDRKIEKIVFARVPRKED